MEKGGVWASVDNIIWTFGKEEVCSKIRVGQGVVLSDANQDALGSALHPFQTRQIVRCRRGSRLFADRRDNPLSVFGVQNDPI